MARLEWSHLAFALLAGTAAAAPPALDPVTSGDLTVSLPRGWKVSADASKGLFAAQRDPARKDAPAVLTMVVGSGNTATEDQLIDAVAAQVAKDLQVVAREALAGGGHLLVANASVGGVPIRLGVIAVAGGGGAMVSLLASRADEFDALGGVELVASMLKSVRASPPPAPAAPSGPPAPRTAASGDARPEVPPLDRALTVSELAGHWTEGGTSLQSYVNTQSGAFAGHSSISSDIQYDIAPDGGLKKKSLYVTTGRIGLRSVNEAETGRVELLPRNVLVLAVARGDKGATYRTYYVVRGWLQTPDRTYMKVNGPWQPLANGRLEEEAFEPNRAWNLNSYWIRAARTPASDGK